MASWGTRRRNLIITIFILIVSFSILTIGFFVFYRAPTCFDNKKNGYETGVDCGGNCELLCTINTKEPVVHWQRYFKLTDGVYNVVAYIENQNASAGASDVEYEFALYDRLGIIIAEREGVIDIRPNQVTPVIENNLNTGELDAARVSFNFGEIQWFEQEPLDNLVSIRKQELLNVDGLPRVTATVNNNTNSVLNNVKFVVILYDREDNALATSNTLVRRIERDDSQNIVFTWPINFDSEPTRFEIIPIYDLRN
jgi:uncharacterized protein YcfL